MCGGGGGGEGGLLMERERAGAGDDILASGHPLSNLR